MNSIYIDVLGQSWCLEIMIRIVLAAVLAAVLGLERTRKLRGAGLRTFILISVGSSACVMTGLVVCSTGAGGDVSRIAAAVVSGVGFIGAGTIIVTNNRTIKGLTTAADLWVASCMGLACGAGFYAGALVLAVVSLSSVVLGEFLEDKLIRRGSRMKISVLFSRDDMVVDFFKLLQELGLDIQEYTTNNSFDKCVSLTFLLRIKNNDYTKAELLEKLRKAEAVVHLRDIS